VTMYTDNNAATPLVSVIIPVKNGMPLFGKVIKAVADQKLPFEYEVIVIDSGSTDGSKEAVPQTDKRFRLIEIPSKSFGHGKTRNLGAELAKGQYCAYLTHDALPANEYWLQNLVRPLLEDQQVAGVFGRHIAYDDASLFTKHELDVHFESLSTWPKLWLADDRRYQSEEGFRQLLHFYSDNSSCLRKSIWHEIPYPNVDFAEDQLWAKMIIERGYRKAFAYDSIVYHSHDYGFVERLRRSFDEAKAFRELFGYRICRTKRELLVRVIKTTIGDLKVATRKGWIWSAPREVLIRPIDNLARQLGYYLGSSVSPKIQRYNSQLSRDKRIQAR